jgi:hypothetical protein
MTWASDLEQRLQILAFARQFLGSGAPDAMWREALGEAPEIWAPGKQRTHWCGVFAFWCCRSVLTSMIGLRWHRGNGISQFDLPLVSDPLRADIAVGTAPAYHHTLVAAEVQGGLVRTIGGNQGLAPGIVGEGGHKWDGRHAYYSIGKWLGR